jgi:hypothetical protein
MAAFGGEIDEETQDNLGVDPDDVADIEFETEADDDAPQPASDDAAALRADLDAVKQTLNEFSTTFRTAYPALQSQIAAQQAAESQPPLPWNQIQNTEQLKLYWDWEQAQRERNLLAHMQQTAAQANAEAHVRGVLNRDTVGAGWSYDDVVGKYVAPLLRQDGRLAEFFSQQQDPAINMYVFGLFHSLLDHFKGDTVKMVKSVIRAMTGPGDASKEAVARLDQATRRGAQKVLRGSNQGGGGRKVSNAFDLPEKEFLQLLAQNS